MAKKATKNKGDGLKQQSAFEFITTYGWAILILAVVIIMLYYFVSIPTTAVPNQCKFVYGTNCQGVVATSANGITKITMVMTNSQNFPIFNPQVRFATDSYGNLSSTCLPSSNIIQPGGEMICNMTVPVYVAPGTTITGTTYLSVTACPSGDENNCQPKQVQTYKGSIITRVTSQTNNIHLTSTSTSSTSTSSTSTSTTTSTSTSTTTSTSTSTSSTSTSSTSTSTSTSTTTTILQYTLTESASPTAGGSVTPGTGRYSPGASVTISETPSSGYYFVDWTGSGSDYSGTSTAYSITINSDTVETANFQPYTTTNSLIWSGTDAISSNCYTNSGCDGNIIFTGSQQSGATSSSLGNGVIVTELVQNRGEATNGKGATVNVGPLYVTVSGLASNPGYPTVTCNNGSNTVVYDSAGMFEGGVQDTVGTQQISYSSGVLNVEWNPGTQVVGMAIGSMSNTDAGQCTVTIN